MISYNNWRYILENLGYELQQVKPGESYKFSGQLIFEWSKQLGPLSKIAKYIKKYGDPLYYMDAYEVRLCDCKACYQMYIYTTDVKTIQTSTLSDLLNAAIGELYKPVIDELTKDVDSLLYDKLVTQLASKHGKDYELKDPQGTLDDIPIIWGPLHGKTLQGNRPTFTCSTGPVIFKNDSNYTEVEVHTTDIAAYYRYAYRVIYPGIVEWIENKHGTKDLRVVEICEDFLFYLHGDEKEWELELNNFIALLWWIIGAYPEDGELVHNTDEVSVSIPDPN